jgi:ATP-dependent exoDNAse (exonuclease V) beta subunit
MHNNLTISASAGAGKTYQLSNRYINLLARGVEPETIVALTFSRKAAGEIADRIVRRLAEAAEDPRALNQLNQGIDTPLTADDCLGLLRKLCMRMPLLRIGTIDSFMAHTVRLFPYELGIQGTFEIIDGLNLQKARQKALREVLNRARPNQRDAFCEQFRRCTFGKQERRITRQINDFIDKYHETLLDAPRQDLWGHAPAIWPDGQPWLTRPLVADNDFHAARATLHDYAETLPASFRKAFLKDINSIMDCSATNAPDVKKIGQELLSRFDELATPPFELGYNRKTYSFPPPICNALHTILLRLLQNTLLINLERTRGLYGILDAYEQAYHRRVRRAGRLSFRDLLQTLTADGTPELSLEGGDGLLYICYRLDGKYHHWMIDEFQDTSNRQWSVFSQLIDEVFQAVEANRTFFYVGDVKQAIYGWRGGDSRLFNRVYTRYHDYPEPATLHKEDLACSWRSAPPVIETVNRVFSNLPADRIPAATVERWRQNWTDHQCAEKNKDLPGYCAFYELPKDAHGENACFNKTVEIIRELRSSATVPLSIAVLVRKNETGTTLVNLLRENGIEAAWEGKTRLADNTVVAALLSLIKLADHPGDTFAWQHIRMTPLHSVLAHLGIESPARLAAQLRRDIHQRGFEYTLSRWIDHCRKQGCTFSDFTRLRLRQLTQYALEFDRDNPPDCLDFITFILQQTLSESPASQAISVLTIHQSKGLEYDAVILPELKERGSIDVTRTDGPSVSMAEDQDGFPAPQWVYDLPSKQILEMDPVLSDHRRKLVEDSAYETLCNLYVAITRAKHAAYMIAEEPGKTSQAYYTRDLLRQQLVSHPASSIQHQASSIQHQTYACGDAQWYTRISTDQTEQTDRAYTIPKPQPREGVQPVTRLQRELPSGSDHAEIPAEKIFTAFGLRAADYGTAMHTLFEQIEWIDQADLDTIITAWQTQSPLAEERQNEIIAEFRRACAAPDVIRALSKPDAPAEVLREQPFELAEQGTWISGCIDRLTLYKDETGHPQRAQIIDYKSSRYQTPADATQLAAGYAPQLTQYRKAAARLLNLPPHTITTAILFTRTGLFCPVK